MSPLQYSFIAVALVSLLSLVGVFGLLMKEIILKRFIFVLVSVSAGALFGDALIHLIPEAIESGLPMHQISYAVLSGILFFLVFEKLLHWRHGHGLEEESKESFGKNVNDKSEVLGPIILFSDGLHNLIDGFIIGASFLVSVEVGIATTIAVVLHEIPQEISDFGLLIHAGYTKGKALFYNFLSSATSLIGMSFVFFTGLANYEFFLPLAIAFAAGGFLYIAGSDLVPEIQKTIEPKKSLVQVLSLFIGVIAMAMLLYLE